MTADKADQQRTNNQEDQQSQKIRQGNQPTIPDKEKLMHLISMVYWNLLYSSHSNHQDGDATCNTPYPTCNPLLPCYFTLGVLSAELVCMQMVMNISNLQPSALHRWITFADREFHCSASTMQNKDETMAAQCRRNLLRWRQQVVWNYSTTDHTREFNLSHN